MSCVTGWPVSGCQLVGRPWSLAVLVESVLGKAAERPDQGAITSDQIAGKLGTWWLIHERHEFIRESRHGASDTDSSHIGASADPTHPTAFLHIAVDHGTPAPNFPE